MTFTPTLCFSRKYLWVKLDLMIEKYLGFYDERWERVKTLERRWILEIKAIWLPFLGTSPCLIIILFYIFPKFKKDHIFYLFLTVLPLGVTMRLITSLIGSTFTGLITAKFWNLVCPFHSRLSGDFRPNLTSISSVSTLKSFISNWLKFWKG